MKPLELPGSDSFVQICTACVSLVSGHGRDEKAEAEAYKLKR
jgi:hypothetical protein